MAFYPTRRHVSNLGGPLQRLSPPGFEFTVRLRGDYAAPGLVFTVGSKTLRVIDCEVL